jgi:hypothetical protein
MRLAGLDGDAQGSSADVWTSLLPKYWRSGVEGFKRERISRRVIHREKVLSSSGLLDFLFLLPLPFDVFVLEDNEEQLKMTIPDEVDIIVCGGGSTG